MYKYVSLMAILIALIVPGCDPIIDPDKGVENTDYQGSGDNSGSTSYSQTTFVYGGGYSTYVLVCMQSLATRRSSYYYTLPTSKTDINYTVPNFNPSIKSQRDAFVAAALVNSIMAESRWRWGYKSDAEVAAYAAYDNLEKARAMYSPSGNGLWCP